MLTAGDYLEISEGNYPLVGLGPRAREAATDEFRLYMKRKKKPAPTARAAVAPAKKAKAAASIETDEQRALF